jgi:hypothetical protein
MRYVAKIDENSVVVRVFAADANIADPEAHYGGIETWRDGGMRKNMAGIGYTYDQELDAFIPPQPFASWGLNPATCFWEAPTPYPTDGHTYAWDEATTSWAAATLGV